MKSNSEIDLEFLQTQLTQPLSFDTNLLTVLSQSQQNMQFTMQEPYQYQFPMTINPQELEPFINPFNQNRRASYDQSTSDILNFQLPIQRKRAKSFSAVSLQEDRTEKNRKAAVRSRLKKKNYLANLEITVDRLTKENKELAEEVNRLKLKLDHLSDK